MYNIICLQMHKTRATHPIHLLSHIMSSFTSRYPPLSSRLSFLPAPNPDIISFSVNPTCRCGRRP